MNPIDALGAEPLDRGALADLVSGIAAQSEIWEGCADTRTPERSYACLHRSAAVDIWVIVWRSGSDTGWHDHDVSSGAVHVVDGELRSQALRVGRPHREIVYRGGDTFSFAPTQIHRLDCDSDLAVSIHAYSPPLWRLGQYSLASDGELRRTSVSYADELRPLEEVA